MLWDEEEQHYCKYNEGVGSGNVSKDFTEKMLEVVHLG
jgi:hypothetical protein